MNNKQIILASASPRRTSLLNEANISHIVIPSNCEEVIDHTLKPIEIVKSLAYQKAKSVFQNNQASTIIGADTIVVINDEILGKPKDEQDAIRMLNLLQDNVHQVITGVSIISKEKEITFAEVSNVYFKPMTKEEILTYITNDYVYDKAGSYAIQSPHATFIDHIEGDYNNIVGLPINALIKHLK